MRLILKAKNNHLNKLTEERVFQIPKIIFEAEGSIDLVNWDMCSVISPKVLENFSIDELKKNIYLKKHQILIYILAPSKLENFTKSTTEVSVSIVGPENFDGFIRATMK